MSRLFRFITEMKLNIIVNALPVFWQIKLNIIRPNFGYLYINVTHIFLFTCINVVTWIKSLHATLLFKFFDENRNLKIIVTTFCYIT